MALPRGPSFALGWLLRYLRDPYGVFAALTERFGDPFFMRLPETPGTVATGHPDGVRTIVSSDNRTLVPWRLASTAALLTDASIFLQAGDAHHAVRRMLAPLFAASRHADHCALMKRVVDAQLDRVRPGPLVAHDLAQEITLRVVLGVLFGEPDEACVDRFRDAAGRALDQRGPILLYLPWLRRRSKRWARMFGAMEDLRQLVQRELDARRRREAAAPPAADAAPGDMLGQLLRARRADGSPVPDREIQVHLADLVVAGHETTTVAVAWACYELARHPRVMARLVDELDAHAAAAAPVTCPRTGAVREAPAMAIAALPYLAAVCTETLRVHPPLVFLTRQVARPLTIRDHEVPPGHGVSIAVPLVHRDAEVYGDPHAFRPERFLERSFGPHEYLPFGGGAKRCLGATFAQQELAIILHGLLSRFTVRLRRDRPVRARPRVITVAPEGGVELVLERRARVPAAAAI